MHRLDSEQTAVLQLLAASPKQATYENEKIVFEDGTEVPQRVMGYLCNAQPPLVRGTIRLSPRGHTVIGYVYEITAAGRQVLDGEN